MQPNNAYVYHGGSGKKGGFSDNLQNVTIKDTYKVKVTLNDRVPNFLKEKLVAGMNVTLTLAGAGADEKLIIGVDTAPTSDHKVKISLTDSTPNFLDTKIINGINTTVTKNDTGGNESIKIDVPDSVITNLFNYKIKVSLADTTPNFLESKLVNGINTTVTKSNVGGNETLKVDIPNSIITNLFDYKVKVSLADTTQNFLENKIVAGDNIIIEKINVGLNEQLKIKVDGSGFSDHKVKVSLTDSTPNFLDTKIINGINTTVTKNDTGGNESIKIDVPDSVITNLFNYKVKVSLADTTPNFLESKLVNGINTTVTKSNVGGNETLKVDIPNSVITNLFDYKVKVSLADTTPNFLESKLVNGINTTVTKSNVGGNETLKVDIPNSVITNLFDYKVKVSLADTTPNFLESKLVNGINTTVTKSNVGGNETLKVDIPNSIITNLFDHKVKVSLADTTPNFLESKIIAGDNVTIVKNNVGANETITINASNNSEGATYLPFGTGMELDSMIFLVPGVSATNYPTLAMGYKFTVSKTITEAHFTFSRTITDRTTSITVDLRRIGVNGLTVDLLDTNIDSLTTLVKRLTVPLINTGGSGYRYYLGSSVTGWSASLPANEMLICVVRSKATGVIACGGCLCNVKLL